MIYKKQMIYLSKNDLGFNLRSFFIKDFYFYITKYSLRKMKSITSYINNFEENYEINESLEPTTISALILLATQIINMGVMIRSTRSTSTGSYDEMTMLDKVKSWLKDKKANKIAKELIKDADIQNFLEQSPRKQQSGWRDLLKSKLTEDDYQYISRLTKDLVKSKA